MSPKNLTFVSAGMLSPKKQDHPFAREHRYLNYGLLGLATIAHDAGHSSRVVHGLFKSPEEVAHRLWNDKLLNDDAPLLLSIPSSFAIGWAAGFAKTIRKFLPKIEIIAGGRWVVGNDFGWLQSLIPELNVVVAGTAEGRILELICDKTRGSVQGTNLHPAPITYTDPSGPSLNYELLEDASEFQPSIEVSRGCGMGCSFCVEKNVGLSSLRNPINIVSEYNNTKNILHRDAIHPYFECSFFRPNSRWAKNLIEARFQSGSFFQWRTESRVDSFADGTLELLAEAGLKVLDLGLESASPAQLLSMKKTTHPQIYLSKASKLLEKCAALGIWCKVNVLLYAGETMETLDETCSWIQSHGQAIKGVSANPVIVYRTGNDDSQFIEELSRSGASLSSGNTLETMGYSFVDLSEEIPAHRALQLCRDVSKRFMSAKDYYDLKSFSYFSDSLSYSKFLSRCETATEHELPFHFHRNLLNKSTEGEGFD
jgi:Radical SAM superfamily